MEPQNNQPQSSPAPGADPNGSLNPTPLAPTPQPAPVSSEPAMPPAPTAAVPPAAPQMPMAADAMPSTQPAEHKKGLPMPILVVAAVVLIGVILALVLL